MSPAVLDAGCRRKNVIYYVPPLPCGKCRKSLSGKCSKCRVSSGSGGDALNRVAAEATPYTGMTAKEVINAVADTASSAGEVIAVTKKIDTDLGADICAGGAKVALSVLLLAMERQRI